MLIHTAKERLLEIVSSIQYYSSDKQQQLQLQIQGLRRKPRLYTYIDLEIAVQHATQVQYDSLFWTLIELLIVGRGKSRSSNYSKSIKTTTKKK